jgi:hypothetical protein
MGIRCGTAQSSEPHSRRHRLPPAAVPHHKLRSAPVYNSAGTGGGLRRASFALPPVLHGQSALRDYALLIRWTMATDGAAWRTRDPFTLAAEFYKSSGRRSATAALRRRPRVRNNAGCSVATGRPATPGSRSTNEQTTSVRSVLKAPPMAHHRPRGQHDRRNRRHHPLPRRGQ